MEDQGIRYMNPIRSSAELLANSAVGRIPLTARPDTPITADLRFQIWWYCLGPSCDQATQLQQESWSPELGSGPPGLSPEQIPEPGSRVTTLSDTDGNFVHRLETFADDQIRVNGTGSVRVRERKLGLIDITLIQRVNKEQDDSLQLTRDYLPGQNSPFVHGNNIYPSGPDLLFNASHGQSSPVLLQQFEETHLISPSPTQHCLGQIVEAIGFTDPGQVLEMGSAQSIKRGVRGPKEWFCSHNNCNKKYRRRQELERHTVDKHRVPHKCLFCNIRWTRPERIRSHLIDQHQGHFTEEECGEIRGLRGRRDTLGFLAKYRTLEASDQ